MGDSDLLGWMFGETTTERPLILFVCTGNICRSPFAAEAARKRLEAAGFEVGSAGTIADRGRPSTDDAVAAAAELGIDLTAHRSRPVTDDQLARAEHVYVMDGTHLDHLRRSRPDAELLDPDGADIADPYGRGIEAYRTAYRTISDAMDRRLAEWGP